MCIRDRYSNRYKDADLEFHRSECKKLLISLEHLISNNVWFFGDKLNKLDISILPFIRQFKIADIDWFDSQKDIPKVKGVLDNFLESKLFTEIMHNYKVWEEGSDSVCFPAKNL